MVGLTALLLGVLSLGGHLLMSGATHQDVTLPWHWLENLPLGGSVLPDRLSILVDGAAATLLAVAIDLGVGRAAPGPDPAAHRHALGGGGAGLPAAGAAAAAGRPHAAAPAGWTAAFAALHLRRGAQILVVPVPEVHLTAAMRWDADSATQYALIGGYFIGPAWNGLAYVDGDGLAPTAVYLDELWATGLRPGSPLAVEATQAGLPAPASSSGAPPAQAQVAADLASWRPAAVVAVTRPDSALAGYLTALLGPPVEQRRRGDGLAAVS